jgi:hypothetical protein
MFIPCFRFPVELELGIEIGWKKNAAIHVDFSGKDDASNRKRGFDKKITRFKKNILQGSVVF